jgi:hypothetical protein
MNQADNPDQKPTLPPKSVAEWRANRTPTAGVEATPPAPALATLPTTKLSDRIRTRRDTTPATTEEGDGSGGGDEGQQQTVARTPLFASLGFKLKNAGQDIPTPMLKRDPMDRPAEDLSTFLPAPTPKPSKSRKLGR